MTRVSARRTLPKIRAKKTEQDERKMSGRRVNRKGKSPYNAPPKSRGRPSNVEEDPEYNLDVDASAAAGGEPAPSGGRDKSMIKQILSSIGSGGASGGADGNGITPAKRPLVNVNEHEEESVESYPEGPTERYLAIGTEQAVGKKWTEEQEMKLCQLWREETHLYDATSPNYRRTDRRQDSIKRIATILDMEGKCNLFSCSPFAIVKERCKVFD